MRTKSYAVTGQAASATSVAAAQAPTAGTAITLTASPVVFGTQATLSGFGGRAVKPAVGTPSEVTLTLNAGATTNTFTVVGTDRWGIATISEQITVTAGATVTGRCVYSQILSITPSVTDGSHTVSAGVPQRVTTPWVALNNTRGFDQANIAYVSVDNVSGSPTWAVEATSVDINALGVGVGLNAGSSATNVPTYIGDSAPVEASAVATFSLTSPTAPIPQGMAWGRLVCTSAAGGATARFVRPGF